MEEIDIEKLQYSINYAICNYNVEITNMGDRYAYFYNSLLEKVLRVYSKHSKEINKWIEEEKLLDNLKYDDELLEKLKTGME